MAGGHSGSWPGFFRVFAVFAALMLLLSQGAQELVSPSSGAWQVLSIYEGLTRWSMPALFLLWGMSALEGGGRGGLSGALLGRALPAFCMLVFWGAAYAVAAHLLGGGALLFLWRLLPRPVLLALLLPVNLPLAGLFTPVVDGLLVAWACAWTGVSLGLWGCLAAALALGIARLPLARWKWARGMPPALLPR